MTRSDKASTVSSCSTSKNNMSHHVLSLSSLPLHQVGHTLQVPEIQETDAVSTGWFPTWVATVDGRKPAATVDGQLFRAYPCLLGFYMYFVKLGVSWHASTNWCSITAICSTMMSHKRFERRTRTDCCTTSTTMSTYMMLQLWSVHVNIASPSTKNSQGCDKTY